ncbi:MAG TPA: DUF2298 domain-containing protein, partial [Roseiflexaceae bacterium]|nr:DUF2298 domain-containing protein [Roseiflexaceae bacterium]
GVGRSALIAGLLGVLFVALIGNLAQAQLLWDALAQWLRERPLGFRAEWWYWNATRAIPHASGEAGPINEMPVFTYLFADLHAHAMALPYTLLTLGLALELIRDPAQPSLARTQWRATPELLTLALLALTLGALWPINSWDAPAYTAVAIAALACREFARRGRVDLKGVWEVVWRAALVIALGQLLFLPFHQTYASDDFGAQLWQGSRTPLRAFLLINGLFLFVIISYLLLELTCGEGANALARSLRLHLRRRDRLARLRRLVARLVRPTPGYRLAVVVVQALLVAALALLPLSRVVGLALALLLLTALLLPRRRPDPPRQFVLCMTGLGLALAVLPELVALSGDIGRVNTLFTAYLQIWVLWGVCAATVLPQIARRLNGAIGAPPPTVKPAEEARSRAVASPQPPRAWMRRAWWLAFGALLAACALYPLTATPARIRDRFKDSRATSLDGAAYMRTSVYDDQGQQVRLDWDRQAIDWLRHNAPPMATILEANTPAYRWGSRVAIYSGLPSVIGWAGHQKQQRWVLPGWAIDQRVEDARTIYTSTDAAQAERLLARYGVRYIYVGPLERIYYGDVGLKKFDQQDRLWSLVYQNEEVKIYAVR